MENQHQKITGYRDLSQGEIDLMNAIKAKGAELNVLVAQIREHNKAQRDAAKLEASNEQYRLAEAEPERWTNIGRTHFQEGLMALTRAVAQPSSF